MIVTAPVLTSASIYVCLTKVLVWAADEGLDLSTKTVLLRRKVVLWTFITIDVFCTILQITGAGLIGGATSNGKDPSSANNILLEDSGVSVFIDSSPQAKASGLQWKMICSQGE